MVDNTKKNDWIAVKQFSVKQAVNVHVVKYTRHDKLKKELCNSLLNYEDKQHHTTNVKATMTEWNITSPEIEILKNSIVEDLKTLPKALDWGPAGEFAVVNMWGNVYRYGEKAILHSHKPEDLTMVYFLKCEEGDAPLTFEDGQIVPAQEGVMAIFPSWVRHGCPEHKSKNVRITLAADMNRVGAKFLYARHGVPRD